MIHEIDNMSRIKKKLLLNEEFRENYLKQSKPIKTTPIQKMTAQEIIDDLVGDVRIK